MAAVLGAFLPSLGHEFISYDDPLYVTENPHVQAGLTCPSVRWAFTSTGGTANWHPVTWLSHMLDCQVFGLRPWGHHLTSVILHAISTALLFLVLQRMTGAMWRSLAVAALFGLHPLRVESVAWVAERKDVLSTFFWLLTILSYYFYTERRPHATTAYAISVLFFTFGLMSKPMLITAPLVLLLVDYWPLVRIDRSNATLRIIEKTPFFLLSGAICVLAFLIQKREGAISMLPELPFDVRVENAMVSYTRYLGKLLYPKGLAVFYPHPGHWTLLVLLSSSLLVLGISIGAWTQRKEHPYVPVGWFWFVVTLVPVIGLVQVGAQSIADRYTYVPSIGIFLLLVWGANDLAKRLACPTVIKVSMTCSAILICTALTVHQLSFWLNSVTLFRHTALVTKNNWRALTNLGAALLKQEKLEEAYAVLRQAVQINPDEPSIHNNLAAVLMRQRRFDEAVTELEIVERSRPNDLRTRVNLGAIFVSRGLYSDAIRDLEVVVAESPTNSAARDLLGIALLGSGRFGEAIAQYRAALLFKPNDPLIINNLGVALMRAGHLDDAITNFQACIQLLPGSAQAYRNLGEAFGRQGLFDEAVRQYRKALKLEPNADGHFQLALVLLQLNRREEAVIELHEALRLRPHYPKAEQVLHDING